MTEQKVIYIAEVLATDKVWLLSEHRRLLSMHTSVREAREKCLQDYRTEPVVVDRRADPYCKL
ncbi:MAG: hypothetical protein RQ899_02665 [Pseudomonadales bacterium]|nr:hypothetical protein [Pseudomonadales bacterium]